MTPRPEPCQGKHSNEEEQEIDQRRPQPNNQVVHLIAEQLDQLLPPAREPQIISITIPVQRIIGDQASSDPSSDPDSPSDNANRMSAKNTLFGYEMPFDVVSAGFAALVAAGGVAGYVKAGSVPSLIAGMTCGAILGFGAYQTSVDPNNYVLSLVASGGLAGLMGSRWYRSGKFMPAGLVTILSIGMVARFTVRAIYQMNQHQKR